MEITGIQSHGMIFFYAELRQESILIVVVATSSESARNLT